MICYQVAHAAADEGNGSWRPSVNHLTLIMPANRLRHGNPFFSFAKLAATMQLCPACPVTVCLHVSIVSTPGVPSTWGHSHLGVCTHASHSPAMMCVLWHRHTRVYCLLTALHPESSTPTTGWLYLQDLQQSSALTLTDNTTQQQHQQHTMLHLHTETKDKATLPCVETSLCLSKKKKHIFH